MHLSQFISLMEAQQRYSQRERKAHAVVWACEHLHLYISGIPSLSQSATTTNHPAFIEGHQTALVCFFYSSQETTGYSSRCLQAWHNCMTMICVLTRQKITYKSYSCNFMIPCEHCWIVMFLTRENKFALEPLLHGWLTKLGMQSGKHEGWKGVGELRKHLLTWLCLVPRKIAWHIWWIKLVRNIIGVLFMISGMIKESCLRPASPSQSRWGSYLPALYRLSSSS